MTRLHTESSEESGNKTTNRESFVSQPANLKTIQAIRFLRCLISSLKKKTNRKTNRHFFMRINRHKVLFKEIERLQLT